MEAQRIFSGPGPWHWFVIHAALFGFSGYGLYHLVVPELRWMGALSLVGLLLVTGGGLLLTVRAMLRRVSLAGGTLEVVDVGAKPRRYEIADIIQIDATGRPVKVRLKNGMLKLQVHGTFGQELIFRLMRLSLGNAKERIKSAPSCHFNAYRRFPVQFDDASMRIPIRRFESTFSDLRDCKLANGVLDVTSGRGQAMKLKPYFTLTDLAAFEILCERLAKAGKIEIKKAPEPPT